jgi:methionyl-tRNA formyltransferase
MKIGFFGDGSWSHNAFQLINDDPRYEIVFVGVRFKNPDVKLINLAKKSGIRVVIEENVNSKDFVKYVENLNLDLIISMSFNQIFKNQIMNLPKFGSINCHAGKLPFYRGRNILNWVLINDEKEFGITVHFMDDGIDTGDIVLQRVFEINDLDSYSSLLEKAYSECGVLIYESVELIFNGNVQKIQQKSIHPYGSYCTKRLEGDERINWNTSSRQIFNFIRALSYPGPSAITFFKNEEIRISECAYITDAPVYKGIAGAILNVQADGFLVKTADSYVKILEWDGNFDPKIGNRLK